MKKLIFLLAAVMSVSVAAAQNYIVVDSEKIFKSVAEYNTAITELDALAEQYQKQVDAKFGEVERLYNTYMSQKASLSSATRQAREENILNKEKEAQQYQESIFGENGTLMKTRVEKIEPIQKRVFAAIEAYARKIGAEVVIDSSNNPTLLYTAPAANHTQQVIDALK